MKEENNSLEIRKLLLLEVFVVIFFIAYKLKYNAWGTIKGMNYNLVVYVGAIVFAFAVFWMLGYVHFKNSKLEKIVTIVLASAVAVMGGISYWFEDSAYPNVSYNMLREEVNPIIWIVAMSALGLATILILPNFREDFLNFLVSLCQRTLYYCVHLQNHMIRYIKENFKTGGSIVCLNFIKFL